jgi:hypothetical protein
MTVLPAEVALLFFEKAQLRTAQSPTSSWSLRCAR